MTDDEAAKKLGQRIREMREQDRHWTQAQLAYAASDLDKVMPPQSIQRIEVGRFSPRMETLRRIWLALGGDPAELGRLILDLPALEEEEEEKLPVGRRSRRRSQPMATLSGDQRPLRREPFLVPISLAS